MCATLDCGFPGQKSQAKGGIPAVVAAVRAAGYWLASFFSCEPGYAGIGIAAADLCAFAAVRGEWRQSVTPQGKLARSVRVRSRPHKTGEIVF
jgi:hypothetical protein